MTQNRRRARTAYRFMLRAYPEDFRDRYGAEMEEAFLALLHLDESRSGALGAARCWAGAAADSIRGGTAARLTRKSEQGRGDVMGTLFSDINYAVRSLVRRPVFACTAIATIAIGIGVNAAVFTVVNGFMFTPLPYEEPDELIAIWAAQPSLGWSGTDVNHADAWDWRERAATLDDLAVFNNAGFNLTGGDAPELVSGVRVTPNFLSLVGRAPALGRDFEPTEIGPGRDGVVILMDGFWERRFARDMDVLGSTLMLDGEQVVVVGIMPPDFLYHRGRPDLIRPWHFEMAGAPRANHSANAIARMTSAAGIDATRAELLDIAGQLANEYPENEGWTLSVTTLQVEVIGEVAAQASVVLMGAVGFILLMACVNVANLLLARAGTRTREIAVRVALGAGRGRVVRQLLTESLVLAMSGGVLGLLMANWGYRAIVSALPPNLPPVFQFEMDGTVLAFTAAITVGAALLFGTLPALRASGDQGGALKDGARSGSSRRSSRFAGALVVMQTAMAVVLLVGGGLLMKSVAGMRSQDFGFEPENVLTARLSLPQAQYASKEVSENYWRDVTERIRDIPGVLSAGTTQSHPLMGSNWGRTVTIAGQDLAEDQARTVRLTLASPGLFEALRFGMVQGRVFSDDDGPDAPQVAIVNEAFVERYLGPNDDPLAQTLLSGEMFEASVIGVVHNVIERGVDDPSEPALYLPIAQSDIRTRSLVLRTAADPTAMVSAVQEAVWAVDADLPIYQVQTMRTVIDDRVGGFAVIGNLMGVFAVISLLLGAVGIYGVTAFTAGQRTNEIGVRLAMGAERADVVRMVVGQGARRTVLGLTVGMGLAALMGGAMSRILIGVSPRDPMTFGVVLVLLSGISFFGLYVPAKKASQIDPVRALAAE
ncbi:MAG: ABC transporter permease [Gemmatimonadetes bacterium]|nr:ABC transporter permease [Gemmatimonadota bacterium]MDA1103927.1 ABC transporter permease [Gemmatimonadota bacterium]